MQSGVANNSTTEQGSVFANLSTVTVKSSPEGAEITIDGKFMGTTLSTLKLPAGEHAVKIEKSGYTAWTRTVTLSSGGNVTVDATLEKKP
jgi:hypothetical protein